MPSLACRTYPAEYTAWANMRRRCLNPRHPQWPDYGGRGIDVDPRWESFATFLADVGRKPSPELSIDRIDNDRGYWPGNVRWATRSEQAINRRSRCRDRELDTAVVLDRQPPTGKDRTMSETATEAASPWMTRAEAAAFLRVGERTIDRYAEASKLTKHRVEGLQSVRFARSEVEALVTPEPAVAE